MEVLKCRILVSGPACCLELPQKQRRVLYRQQRISARGRKLKSARALLVLVGRKRVGKEKKAHANKSQLSM